MPKISMKLTKIITPAERPRDTAKVLELARFTREGKNTTAAPMEVAPPARITRPMATPRLLASGGSVSTSTASSVGLRMALADIIRYAISLSEFCGCFLVARKQFDARVQIAERLIKLGACVRV